MSVKQQSTSGEDIPELKDDSADTNAPGDGPAEQIKTEARKANRDRIKKAVKSTLSDLVLKPDPDSKKEASSAKTTDNLVGQVVFQKYAISGVVEKDGCSVTYKARNVENREKVFLKTPIYVTDEISAAFKSYASTNLSLEHENIVNCVECLEEKDGRPFLVYRRFMAVQMDDLLEEVGCISTPNEFADILSQLLTALEYAHEKGVKHGLILPSSVHLVESEGVIGIKLADFDSYQFRKSVYDHIAEEFPAKELGFFNPEILRQEEINNASDIYNVGLLAFFLLTGDRPYAGDSREELFKAHCEDSIRPEGLAKKRRDFHNIEDLEKLIFETLDSDVDWRLQKAADLKEELRLWLEAEPKSTPLQEENEITEEDVSALKSSKGDLKSTVHNLVALRRHQVEQEETVMMKFTDAVAKSGPRQSPRKAAMKLIITYVGGALFLLLMAIYGILHWDTINEAYRTHSLNLSSLFGKNEPDQAEAEDQDMPPIEGDPLEPGKISETPGAASSQSSAGQPNSTGGSAARKGSTPSTYRRRVFRYEESPAYMPFIPKKKGSKPIIIE